MVLATSTDTAVLTGQTGWEAALLDIMDTALPSDACVAHTNKAGGIVLTSNTTEHATRHAGYHGHSVTF